MERSLWYRRLAYDNSNGISAGKPTYLSERWFLETKSFFLKFWQASSSCGKRYSQRRPVKRLWNSVTSTEIHENEWSWSFVSAVTEIQISSSKQAEIFRETRCLSIIWTALNRSIPLENKVSLPNPRVPRWLKAGARKGCCMRGAIGCSWKLSRFGRIGCSRGLVVGG